MTTPFAPDLAAHPVAPRREPNITAFGQCPIDMARRLGCNTRLCNIVRPKGETYHGVTPGTQSLEDTRPLCLTFRWMRVAASDRSAFMAASALAGSRARIAFKTR